MTDTATTKPKKILAPKPTQRQNAVVVDALVESLLSPKPAAKITGRKRGRPLTEAGAARKAKEAERTTNRLVIQKYSKNHPKTTVLLNGVDVGEVKEVWSESRRSRKFSVSITVNGVTHSYEGLLTIKAAIDAAQAALDNSTTEE